MFRDLNKEEIIAILNKDLLIISEPIAFMNFHDYLDIQGATLSSLLNNKNHLDSTVLSFISELSHFNRENPNTVVLPCLNYDEGEPRSFHGFSGVSPNSFDENLNFINKEGVRTFKNFTDTYVVGISISSNPYDTLTHYNFRDFTKTLLTKLNI